MIILPKNHNEPYFDLPVPTRHPATDVAAVSGHPGPVIRSRRLIGRALVRLGQAINVENPTPALR